MKLIVALLCLLSVSGQKDPNYLPSNENVTLGLPQPPLVPLNGTEPIQVGYILVNATSNATLAKRDVSGTVSVSLPYVNYYRLDFSPLYMYSLYYTFSFTGAYSRVWVMTYNAWSTCKSSLSTCSIYRTWSCDSPSAQCTVTCTGMDRYASYVLVVINMDYSTTSIVSGSYIAYASSGGSVSTESGGGGSTNGGTTSGGGTTVNGGGSSSTEFPYYAYPIIAVGFVGLVFLSFCCCCGKNVRQQGKVNPQWQQRGVHQTGYVDDSSPTNYGYYYGQPTYSEPGWGNYGNDYSVTVDTGTSDFGGGGDGGGGGGGDGGGGSND
ncbi:hypothetical protein EDD86DRAFT_203513 [Gorgonomyces haynaldii]|nr:hypothetical protein EDD86DRAFT_203513 [Gorgonomyces haynaldii]